MTEIWQYVKQSIWKLWFVNFLSLTIPSLIIPSIFFLMHAYAPLSNTGDQTISIHVPYMSIDRFLLLLLLSFLLSISFLFAGLYATTAEIFADGCVRIRTYFIKGSLYTLKLLFTYVLMWVPAVFAHAIIALLSIIQQFTNIEIEEIAINTYYLSLIAYFSPFLIFIVCIHIPLLIIIEQQKPLQALRSYVRIFLSKQNRTAAIVATAWSICSTLIVGVLSGALIIPLMLLTNSNGIIWLLGIEAILALCLTTFGLISTYYYFTSFRQQFLHAIELSDSALIRKIISRVIPIKKN